MPGCRTARCLTYRTRPSRSSSAPPRSAATSPNTAIRVMDLSEVRQRGAANASDTAVEHLSRPDLAGFWVHLDADVLDDLVMPAVDYRMPGGLSWDELVRTLRAAADTGKAVGISVRSSTRNSTATDRLQRHSCMRWSWVCAAKANCESHFFARRLQVALPRHSERLMRCTVPESTPNCPATFALSLALWP
jgi:hypothetical protein